MTNNPIEQPQSLTSHLIELRSRLLKIVIVFLGIFLCLTPFAKKLYTLVAAPLIQALPETTFIVLQVTRIAILLFVLG